MNKLFTFSLLFAGFGLNAQSYAPPAGTAGTTALKKDSSAFIAWATGATVQRGFLQASDTTIEVDGNNKASFGVATNATGPAEGSSVDVVSLGDGGMATLTFAQPITNGPGPDFAVFENALDNTFLELGFVEVSSDGVHFFRFPAHSEVQTATQVSSFGATDCRYVNNLAGKYRQGFGTPFDLSDLPVDALLNLDAITHVRVLDVIGAVEEEFGTHDSQGNMVNDPFPTAFASGGFDLDAVGVIHQQVLGMDELTQAFSLYPNPSTGIIYLKATQPGTLEIFDLTGRSLYAASNISETTIDLSQWSANSIFRVRFTNAQGTSVRYVILQ
jgi:hypothetical protein